MENNDYESVMRRVAEREGTTPETIRREIAGLIDCCWQNAQTRKAWALIWSDGKKPTPEELIAYASGRVCREIGAAGIA